MDRVYTTPLLDKLGVRIGARVALVGIEDEALRRMLAERAGEIAEGEPPPETDLVFLGADSPEELAALPRLRAAIRPDGAIWVVSRKGGAATLRDVEVMAAARPAGLVDNKVVAVSPTHTALRLVIPKADRPR